MAIPQPSGVPNIKSLLKKSPPLADNNAKHNRNVSFNQTVIVFCEEVETSSPSDQFEPPLGYQDPLDSTEQIEEYNDQKVVQVSKGEATVELSESYSRTLDRCADNLTDDQLIGLLEDEFKINCEDLSEEDFPVNYLNSSHSYLCVDAISDYDSDSESSLFVERKETSDITSSVNTEAKEQAEVDLNIPKSNKSHVKVRSSTNNSASTTEEKFDGIPENSLISEVEPTKAPTRQMPARVKVSTVDTTHTKRQQQSRKDDQDARSKLELINNRKDANAEHKASEVVALGGDIPPNPVKLKQTDVEPVSRSRSLIINNTAVIDPATNSTASLQRRTETENGRQAPMFEQTSGESNPSREIVAHPQTLKARHLDQPNVSGINQSQRNTTQAQIACHVCRAIDPVNRLLAAAPFKDQNVDHDGITVQPSSLQVAKKAENHQPGAFNQACISCRENLVRQNQQIQEGPSIQGAGIAQTRPVTYQLVYVVDQKGNRVRALSLRPAAQVPNPQQQPLNGRRILIAQNNVRFPNPVAINGHPVSITSSQQMSQNQWSQNHPAINQNPQYRIISSLPHPHIQQNQFTMAGPKVLNGLVRVPLDGVGLRQHTVYYVRQPLDAQNISQRLDPTSSNSRSFPEPHEIRRLDGLREPPINPNLSTKVDQSDGLIQHNPRSGPSMSKDETDDPTFGFSNRPSVKVVATNSSFVNTIMNRSQNQQTSVKAQYSLTNGNSAIRHYVDPNGNLRPVSLLITGSQTLDRRQIYQQQPALKENVPSTSSMSNIHGTMSHLSQGQSAKVNLQQRISTNPSSEPTTSNIKPLEITNFDMESKNGVIVNNRATSSVVQNGQSSSLKGKDAIYDSNRRTNQEQTQVAYSMNI